MSENVGIYNGNDVTARLNHLKSQIEQGKTEKARAEANLETYEAQKKEHLTKLAELGVAPENIDAEIERLDKEIAAQLAEAEALLNPSAQAAA